jgi:hypothetical protein
VLVTRTNVRLLCLAITCCLLPGAARAQDGLRSASLPERNLRTPDPAAPPSFRAGPLTFAPPDDPRFKDPVLRFDITTPRPFFGGFAPFESLGVPWWAATGYSGPVPFRPPNGYLQLQVAPAVAEVLVDGFYVGSVNDVRGMAPGYALEPGSHRIELRAAGFEPAAFSVRVASGETIMYRRDLEAAPRPPAPLPAPGVPKTFYVIPGCYAGDRPPQTVQLPPMCDPAKARTIPPQVNAVSVTGSSPAPVRQ